MKMKSLQEIYLGEFQIVRDDKKQNLEMVIKRKTNKKEEMNNQIINLQNRKKISHHNLIQLKKFEEQKISQLCSTFYEVRAFYEYFPNNLKLEIQKRKKTQDYFSAIQILRFIYDSVDVFQYLEQKGIKHNELNPLLLFLAEDQQSLLRIKVSERLNGYSNSLANAYDALNTNMDIYLDPKSFEDLTQGKKHSTGDPFKVDVFALGVIFLEAGLLESAQSIYNILGGHFQYQLLDQLFEKFQEKYSKNTLLLSVISKMIEIDENKRPQFWEIKDALPKWSQVYEISLNHFDPIQQESIKQRSPKKLYPYKSQKQIPESNTLKQYQPYNTQQIFQDDFEQLQTEKSFDDFMPEETKNNFQNTNFKKQKNDLIISHETQDLKILAFQDKNKKNKYKKQQLYQFTQSKTLTQSQKQISISSNPNYFFKRGSHKNKPIQSQSIQWDEIDFTNSKQNNLQFDVLESQYNNEFTPQKEFSRQYQNDSSLTYDKQQRESQRTIIKESIDRNNEEIFQNNNIPKYCKSANGIIYKSIVNEKDEYNEEGVLVRRVYVNYQPVENEEEIQNYEKYQNQVQQTSNIQQMHNRNNSLQQQLAPIKETYSDTFNTLEYKKNSYIKDLQSSIQAPLQNQQNFEQYQDENINRVNQHMYETDFFNISEESQHKLLKESQESIQDFFQVLDNSNNIMKQSTNFKHNEFPQIDTNQFIEQPKYENKNPYMKQNKVKQSLADMLRDYKENEDYYNSALKQRKLNMQK